jgi:Zn-dependent membrane protease YugP
MFYFNPQYLLFMAPALLAMLAAQWYVNSTYKKWGRIPNRSGISEAEAARRR